MFKILEQKLSEKENGAEVVLLRKQLADVLEIMDKMEGQLLNCLWKSEVQQAVGYEIQVTTDPYVMTAETEFRTGQIW